jgi:hypothetical protein
MTSLVATMQARFDDALQFADVAGPRMRSQVTDRLFVHALDGLAQLGVEALREVADEERNVVAARAQRRHDERDDGERSRTARG